jgi:cysteine desulfurase/selenocysteine lyase
MITYLDAAATTHPKPDAVYEKSDRFLRDCGVSAERASHRLARTAGEAVAAARRTVAKLIHAPDATRVVFTRGATESLNVALKGLLEPGDHVVTTALEHNSVNRPLATLARTRQVAVARVAPGGDGRVTAEAIEAALTDRTKVIALTHASNVTGVVQPLEAIARLAQARGIALVLDAAQTAGCWPIDVTMPGIAAVAFSGHKGTFGPPGTGVLWLREGVTPAPLVEGGTGFNSESDRQPDELPGRYEAGTANVAGIVGLAAGIEWVLEKGVESIRAHAANLTDLFLREGGPVDGVTMYAAEAKERTGVVSFTMAGYDPEDLAAALDSSFDIAVRAGLHCAPGAHQALGTFPKGTVRMSVSALTTEGEVNYLVEALHQMAMLA